MRARRWATAGSAIANRAPLAELFGTSAAADVAPGFAWQSLALIEYVAAEKGERAVGRLAESLLAGRTTAEALTALKLDVATLDASWAQWAAAHVARGGSE